MAIKKFLDAPFEVKSVDESGVFTGYGSVFGTLDSYKDIVVKGAFSETLSAWRQKGRLPALLWQHDIRKPAGVYTAMREDKNGLYVEGQLALKTRLGQEAFELMKMDALGGLSIGFVTKEEAFDHDTGIRQLKKVDLFEVSLVTFPANEDAKIASVKNALRCGEIPEMREVEGILREAGFSHSQAKAILAGGYARLCQREAGDDSLKTEALNESLQGLLSKMRI